MSAFVGTTLFESLFRLVVTKSLGDFVQHVAKIHVTCFGHKHITEAFYQPGPPVQVPINSILQFLRQFKKKIHQVKGILRHLV